MLDIPNRACVIGAGSSGITAAKVLKDYGIPFDLTTTRFSRITPRLPNISTIMSSISTSGLTSVLTQKSQPPFPWRGVGGKSHCMMALHIATVLYWWPTVTIGILAGLSLPLKGISMVRSFTATTTKYRVHT